MQMKAMVMEVDDGRSSDQRKGGVETIRVTIS